MIQRVLFAALVSALALGCSPKSQQVSTSTSSVDAAVERELVTLLLVSYGDRTCPRIRAKSSGIQDQQRRLSAAANKAGYSEEQVRTLSKSRRIKSSVFQFFRERGVPRTYQWGDDEILRTKFCDAIERDVRNGGRLSPSLRIN